MTKRQMYTQLDSAKCKQSGKVEGHLNYMCRLKGRLNTVRMTVDDAVFSGMLVSSLLSNDRFDRLRGYVDAAMDGVDTPEKVVTMAITFDKANQADDQLNRSFDRSSSYLVSRTRLEVENKARVETRKQGRKDKESLAHVSCVAAPTT
ncbi:hypothetical protein PHYPSEUDO_001304 [Phytophthora pseudosyringae]|uniref:Uncharacterized protein n=1 Tax=Phytophthora pseudosyringae TaxID=221518 RepID=A0A8T1VZ33_9STRA|nr:hypothetical protein PHYPSEUDO_001304 [Phytophthora pseudosyringae]